MHLLLVVVAVTFATGLTFALAEEASTATKAKDAVVEAGRDTKKVAKKAVRKIKDKTCTMVKGKMECAAEKVQHGIENTVDEVKDKADDIKK